MSTHIHDWRGIDIGRMCFECGEIENQMKRLTPQAGQHQGDCISGLIEMAWLSSVDYRDPEQILLNVSKYLSDRMCDEAIKNQLSVEPMNVEGNVLVGDLDEAWGIVAEVRQAFCDGETRVCLNCKKLMTQHDLDLFCRIRLDWTKPQRILSPRWEPRNY